jgi:lipoprotein-anchoring transpeptidase ErfK/SrfK
VRAANANLCSPSSPTPSSDQHRTALEPAPADEPDDAKIDPRLKRQIVDYNGKEAAGTIIVDTPHTFLYYVLGR